MEIIDLLSGFDLDHISEKDLQNLSRGLAVTFIQKPVLSACAKSGGNDYSGMRSAVSDAFVRYLKKALQGNLLDKVSMVASVTAAIASGKSLPAVSDVPLDPSGLVSLVSKMHLHHMSEEDFRTLADAAASLLLREGPLDDMENHHVHADAPSVRTVTAAAADRIYTGLKMALADKDELLQAAEESKERHRN